MFDEKSEYIKIQDSAWEIISNLDDETPDTQELKQALEYLGSLELWVENGNNILGKLSYVIKY